MKLKKYFFCIFYFLILLVGALAAELEDLPLGTIIKSPDSHFAVLYGYNQKDARPVYRIQNNLTGESYKTISALPCYLIQWTENSNNVVCIEMMSDGYHAKILHFNKNLWDSFYLEDLTKENFVGSSVVRFEVLNNLISITRVARYRNNNKHHSFFCYKVTCLLDPNTKKIIKYENSSIGEDDYLNERYSLDNAILSLRGK